MKNNKEEETIVNINSFKKIWYSITNFEKYPAMAAEGFPRAILYLIIMTAFVTIFMTISSVIQMKNVVGELANYINDNLPEFSYKDGIVEMETDEPIIISDVKYNGIDKIIINPFLENDEEKAKFEEENDTQGVTLFFFKNQIIIRTKLENLQVNVSPFTYKDFISNYTSEEIKEFNKAELVEYLKSDKMNSFYMNYSMAAFMELLIVDIIVTMVNALEIAIFGWITTWFARIRMRFIGIYNMAVYALTLPMILNIAYIIVNCFVDFTISYFQVAYITIAYIYLAAVIFILKDDIARRMQEVERIRKEQAKVREEIRQQEEKKEEKPSVEPRDEKKDDKKDDDKNTNEEEPKGSEA